jgi:electron transport complex protein RnfD
MKLILSSSPHAHAKNSVHSMMRDVILALLPAAGCAVWFFGLRAVWLIATCIAASVVTEAVCRLAMKRENSIGDLSATLTGLLLALNLPPDLPLWMAAVGGVFAIAVAKQAFGGLGYNPFNPALAARAFMLISFTGAMTTWAFPRGYEAVEAATNATPVDAVTCATPLALIKKGDVAQLASLKSLLLGNIGGCIGETCAIALLIGAAYLLIRRVITWHIPVSFLATVFVFAFFKGGVPPVFHVLSGGAILGACFMATDYVT